jgi:bifunctional non-homologous end joining protein LigD
LNALEQTGCPFSPRPPGWLGKHAHWVKPERVAEVAFSEWTDAGLVRHGSLQGFRTDKSPREVTRELPEASRISAGPSARAQAPGKKRNTQVVSGVRVTNGARLVYPDLGISKLDLARYFERIAEHMLPHVRGRPLTLVRCAKQVSRPDALRSECSFLRHTPGMNAWAPASMRRLSIPELKKVGEYLVVETPQDLVALAQGDAVEIHAWNASADRVEQPDRLVFDLDPAPDVPWQRVVCASYLVREQLERIGLASWVKLTGGKGLHVIAPMEPELTWTDAYRVAKLVANSLVVAHPELFVASFAKAARKGRILVDAKRNHRGALVVCAFSPRAQPEAPVAVPVAWEELPGEAPPVFDVRTVIERVAKMKHDPWEKFWSCSQRLARPDRQVT